MKLSAYAISKGGTATLQCPVLTEIAGKVGCSPATLYMIAKGHKKASGKLAKRISEETENDVTPGDLREDIFGPAPANELSGEASIERAEAGPERAAA